MAASGALGPFLDAMMKLRAQRLEEQKAKDAGMSALGEGIAGGISSIGSSIGSAVKEGKTNAIANTLMNQQNPPVAGGTLPSGAYQQPGTPATGGVKELELRKAMGQYDKSSGLTAYQEMQMQQRDQAARVAEAKYNAQQAESKARYVQGRTDRESDKFREAQQDVSAYYAKTRDVLTKMQDPENELSRGQHDAAADTLRGYNAAAIKQGLDIQPVAIPQYISRADKLAIAAAEKAKQASLQSTPYMAGSGPSTLAYEQAQQKLQGVTPSGLGAYGTPQYSPNVPAEQPLPYTPPPRPVDPYLQQQQQQPTSGTGGGGTQPGYKKNKQTGEVRYWDGTKFL